MHIIDINAVDVNTVDISCTVHIYGPTNKYVVNFHLLKAQVESGVWFLALRRQLLRMISTSVHKYVENILVTTCNYHMYACMISFIGKLPIQEPSHLLLQV